jgi:hypothetical protein
MDYIYMTDSNNGLWLLDIVMFKGLIYRNDHRGLYNGLRFWNTFPSPSGVILKIHVLLSIPNFQYYYFQLSICFLPQYFTIFSFQFVSCRNILLLLAFNLFLLQYCLND